MRVMWLFCMGVAACGHGAGTPVSGVDPDETLGELDVSDLEQVCRSVVYNDYGLGDADRLRWTCFVTAISLHKAIPLFDCESSAESCIAMGPQTDATACQYDASVIGQLGPCADISVGEIDDCLAALDQRAQAMVGTISCASSPDAVLDPPGACATIDATCPDPFGK